MNKQLTPLIAVATLTFGLIASVAMAQTAPSARTDAKATGARQGDDGDVTTLSPFVVSTQKDTGYIAADTLSAGRLSTNLLMTPGDIDVLTRDLINDLGVFNIDEASGWLTNSRPLELGAIEGNSMNPGSLAQSDSGSNVNMRGFAGGTSPSTRNYFTSSSTPKEYNVDRVEASRGPNAILYGEGGPGGNVNYITKRAQSRNFTTLRLRTDSLSSKGVSLDVNRRITDKVDFRYNLNLLDQRYHIARSRFKETGNAFNVVIRPFERTSITIDLDVTRNSRPGLIMTYGEQYSKWDRAPIAGKITGLTAAQITAKGLTNWTGAHYWTWVDGLGMLDLTGYAHTIGYGLPIPTEYKIGTSVFPGIDLVTPPDRGFNANPTQTDVVDHAHDFQVSIDHIFKNKISLQLAAQYSKYTAKGGNYTFTTVYVDPLTQLPNGQANPNYGKPFSHSFVGRSIDAERGSKTARFVAAYPLDVFGTKTNFSTFLQHQEQHTDTTYLELHMVDATSALSITDASSLIHIYRYWDNLPSSMPDFTKLYNTVNVPTFGQYIAQEADSFEAAASGSYFHDTLSVIAGFRRDKSTVTTKNGDLANRDRVNGQFTTYTIDPRTAFNNTATVGLVYFPIKYVGAYYNHAEGFITQTLSNPQIDGSYAHANIVPATDESYGLRFHLARGKDVKVVGSVGYYKVSQEHLSKVVGVGNINSLWQHMGKESNYITTFSLDPVSTSSTNSIQDFSTIEGEGWEGSLTANIGNSLRLTVNGALPKTKQSDVAAQYVAYVNAHMAEWTAWANNPANLNATADKTNVNQINGFVSNFFEGRAQNLTYKYRYNALAVYTFKDTLLKGLRVGLGSQFFGPSIIGNDIGLPYSYVYAKSYYVMTGSLGYTFKVRRQKVDVQLNVANLLNYEEPIFNGLFTQSLPAGGSVNIPYGFKYNWPRQGRLTVTIPF